jgi:myo-inositol-1(or 4)-monophosphatase
VVRLGRLLAEPWHGSRSEETRFKKDREVVTRMDLEVERALRQSIRRAFPRDAVLGEELPEHRGSSGWTWVLDPIDGTSNFAHGIPFFSICAGLLHRGRTVGGIVHDPLRRETFWAWSGHGAFLGRRRLHLEKPGGLVHRHRRLCDSLVVIHSAPRPSARLALGRLRILLPRVRTFRFLGSGSLELSYLAAGRIDAVVSHTEQERHLHDVAPGLPIVREAGLRVTIFGRRESQRLGAGLVAAEAGIHDEIVGLLRSAAR